MAGASRELTAAMLVAGRVPVAGSDPAAEVLIPRAVPSLSPPADQAATTTALPDGRALIAGGYDPSIQPTASTWIYQP